MRSNIFVSKENNLKSLVKTEKGLKQSKILFEDFICIGIVFMADAQIARTDDPVLYWFFIVFFFLFSILFLRSYLKDRKLVENKI